MINVEKVKAVQKIQEFINNHSNDMITLTMLAKEVNYSTYYVSRIFKELIGMSLFEYIRKLRLSRAALKLRDEDVKVVDVAFDFVFDSHEGFTRAFSKQFGITPKKYAINTPPIPLFSPDDISDYYRIIKKGDDKMSEVKAVFTQVVERPARKLLLKRGSTATHYFEYCDEVGCDVWGILSSVKEALYEPVGVWLPENMIKSGTSIYAHGVEVPVDYNGDIPEGFDIIELKPCKMMIFQGQPYDECNFREEVNECMDFIKKFDPTFYGFEWDIQIAPRFQLAPMGYRGYIEGKPVRVIND